MRISIPRPSKGSYAGAMGAPQFMPSNYRRYAVDADANGRIDLWNDWPDVCASVGNYLKEHGWNAGEPVLSEATVLPEKAGDLDGRKLALSETVGSLAAKGVSFDSALPPDAPAILIAADEPDGVHWRVGYNNFYVITRYNHSALYAMAVYELAAAVKQRMLANDAAARQPLRRTAATRRREIVACAARCRCASAIAVGMAACFSAPPRPRPRVPRRRRAPDGTAAAPDSVPDMVPRSRTAFAQRQSAVLRCVGQALLRAVLERRLRGARCRVLVWTGLPQGPNLHRRALRYVRHDGCPQDAALAGLCARHQSAKRAQCRGSRQRSRPLRRQSHHRPVLHGRIQTRHAAQRHRHGGSAQPRCRIARAVTARRTAGGCSGRSRRRSARRTGSAASPASPRDGVAQFPSQRALFIQAGAFSDPKNAERLAEKLRGGGYGKVFVRDDEIAGRRMYRVRIGPVPERRGVRSHRRRTGARRHQRCASRARLNHATAARAIPVTLTSFHQGIHQLCFVP